MEPKTDRTLSAGKHAELLIRRIHDLCAHGLDPKALADLFRQAESCTYGTRDEMAADLGVPAPMLKYWMRRKRFPTGLRMKGVLMRLRRRLIAVISIERPVEILRVRLRRGTIDSPLLVYPPAVDIWWTSA